MPPAPPPAAQAGILEIQSGTSSIDEQVGTAGFTLTRAGGSDGAVSVTVSSNDGSARAGEDYAALSTTISFAAGEAGAKIVPIAIQDDQDDEDVETFSVALSSPTGGATLGATASITLSLIDDDAPPAASPKHGSLEFVDASTIIVATEHADSVSLLVRRVGGTDGGVSATVSSSDDSAVAERDYGTVDTTVSFADGEGGTKLVTVTILDDAEPEADELLRVALSAPTGGAELGSGSIVTIGITDNEGPPAAPALSVRADIKQLTFAWDSVPLATGYALLHKPDAHSAFEPVVDDLGAHATSATLSVSAHALDWVNGRYVLEACNPNGCTSSPEISALDAMLGAIGYFKASNTDSGDNFGQSVAVSADGDTLAVGAPDEDSQAVDIGGDQDDNSAYGAGAVYVFVRDASAGWVQQAYIKASNTRAGDSFGHSLALSGDGDTLAVGAPYEDGGGSTGCIPIESCRPNSGAAYVFTRDGAQSWAQRAYLKASAPGRDDLFGRRVALSADGSTLAVATPGEDLHQQGGRAGDAGAVYVFTSDAAQDWTQQAYVTAPNAGAGDMFGLALALSRSGDVLAVGAPYEDSSASGIDGDHGDDSAAEAGSVYVFQLDAGAVGSRPPTYVKAFNTGANHQFGRSLALSGEGTVLAVGAPFDGNAGAVHTFTDDGTAWSQQAHVQASNTEAGDLFGHSVALSADGTHLAVSAAREDSTARGVGDGQLDNDAEQAGAVYVFVFDDDGAWMQQAYVKATNTEAGDLFGSSLALSEHGELLAVSATSEASIARGVDGDQDSNAAPESGAVYVY